MKEAVLLLHGLLMNQYVMSMLATRFRQAGYDDHAFTYHTLLEGIEEHVAATLRQIEGMNSERIHVVGHSMGGVVALKALQRMHQVQPRGGLRRIGRLLLLGSPLTGCESALQAERQLTGRWMLGKSIDLWKSGYPLDIPPGIIAGSIAGDKRFGLGAMLGSLDGVNDGVVQVDETRLPGLADHLVLPVSHSGMLISNAVAQQCLVFMRDGRFEHRDKKKHDA